MRAQRMASMRPSGFHGGRGNPAAMAHGLQKPDGKTVKRLLSYLGAYKGRLTVVVICILLSALTNVSGSLFLGTLIDDYIKPLLLSPQGSVDYSGLLQAVLQMGMIYLAGILASFLYNFLMVGVSQGVMKTIRDQTFAHMQSLPMAYFDRNSHGDVMSRYTNDTDTLRQMLSQSLPAVFSSLVTILAVFCTMLYTSGWLTLFVVLFLFLILQVTKKVAGRSSASFKQQQASLGDLNGYIEEMINGQKIIKVFCHEKKSKMDFNEKNDRLCTHSTRANQFANILMPILMNLGHIQYVLVAILGGTMAISGFARLTLGNIATFLQLSRSFNMPIGQVSQQLNMVIMAIAGAGRIFQLMDEKSEADQGYVTLVNAKYDEKGELSETAEHTGLWAWKHPHGDGTLTYTALRGEVRMYNVDFAYEEGKPVLRDITLYAEPGQKVALVGATGAGKTTITNLINRFYDISDGKIRYDGININKIRKTDLRRSLGVVLQDVQLFTGTVMENIRYGYLEATEEQVVEAAKLANAHDFITRLPHGYHTLLEGGGASLSQGQRQLISIARAAVADPPVMILDEATSSIDTHTEALVQEGMDRLMKGRTVFVIAHRLSTIHNADVIMVMSNGEIIERGNHHRLMEEKGQYYQLYTGAFELD